MQKLNIKYAAYNKALPPRPIRVQAGSWAGESQPMRDGSQPQPWHCLPFVEGSIYGLELLYPFETECHVVNDGTGGDLRFEWDYASEPAGGVTGGEFISFFPKEPSRFYLFNIRLDLQPPPGHVIRTEPHPRFFTDDTGTFPLAMIGHVQAEWYPRQLFVVFRAPPAGGRHVFRKGEPYAQIIFVPHRVNYELTPMTPEEEAQRRDLERRITQTRSQIADNVWLNPTGNEFNNHYKVLSAAFTRGGLPAVEEVVDEAMRRHRESLPADKTIPEALAVGHERLNAGRFDQARAVFSHVLERDPDNADALSHLGIAVACTGSPVIGLQMLARAAALAPRSAVYHANLGEMLRMTGRFDEAAASFRNALQLTPHDAGLMSVLGLTLAQQGRGAEALQVCQAALAMAPQMAVVHYRTGLVLAQQGRAEEARARYEAALALDPGFEPAQQALGELAAGKPARNA